jgi:putative transposase
MPRLPRFTLPGIPQHVVQRGNNRQAIFFDESDHLAYLEWLGKGRRAYRVEVHAYVLMTNHVHLLLTPRVARGIGRLMQYLGRHYVAYINRVYGRTGTLWEGRYKAAVVQTERYFLACQRYIELNPVRAEMVSNPADYRWSSYRANAHGKVNALLTPHEEYLGLGRDVEGRQRAYSRLFEHEIAPEELEVIRKSLRHNHVLGDDRFRDEIGRMMKRRIGRAGPGRPAKAPADRSSDGRQRDLIES